jgi:hypothetical protein
MKIKLHFLNDKRKEVWGEINVSPKEHSDFADVGMQVVEAHVEFSISEIREMSRRQLASLGASSEVGYDAYSLACSSGLG